MPSARLFAPGFPAQSDFAILDDKTGGLTEPNQCARLLERLGTNPRTETKGRCEMDEHERKYYELNKSTKQERAAGRVAKTKAIREAVLIALERGETIYKGNRHDTTTAVIVELQNAGFKIVRASGGAQ